MSSITKDGNTLSKKDLTLSRLPAIAARNVTFYHEATLGQTVISLLSLSMPASIPFSQATPDELSGARLFSNRRNLELKSSAHGALMAGEHYDVLDANTIKLKGPYAVDGALAGEIFEGKVYGAPISDLIAVSAKTIKKTYVLPVGQNIVNLGQKYQVGLFPTENVGVLRVSINGVEALRNSGNSSTILDKDYYEVDSGDGSGTTIYVNVAPASIEAQIMVDFGIQAITDQNAFDTIEALSGSVKKLADDLAVVAGTDADDYHNANPSEVERRAFGNMVLDHDKNKADKADLNYVYLEAESNSSEVITLNVTDIPYANTLVDTHSAWNGSQYTIPESGLYKLTAGAIYTTSAARAMNIFKNGVSFRRLIFINASQSNLVGSYTGYFTKGEVISIRETNNAGTLSPSTIAHFLTIGRIPGQFN